MASESDVPALLRRLRGRSPAAQAQAAARLRQLAKHSTASCEAIVTADGIRLLLDLLADGSRRSSTAALQQHAAATLLYTAARCDDRRPDVVAAGGVATFVRCLGSGRPVLQELAARALAVLASDNSETCDAICAACGLAVLVRLLQQGSFLNVRAAAAFVLAYLSQSGGEGILEAIAADALPPLIAALQAPLPVPVQLHRSAASTLCSLAKRDAGHSAEQAAACSRRRASIVAAGGVPALLHVLQGSRDGEALLLALRALGLLVEDAQCAEALAAAGGIPALVHRLGRGSGGDEELQVAAAGALRSVTAGSPERQEAAVDAGAVQSLLEALHGGRAQLMGPVLGALCYLAAVPGQADAMIDAGAVPNIALAMQSGGADSTPSAAVLLSNLVAHCSPDSHAAFVAAGGVPTLEQLLHRCQDANVQAAAARALRALSTPPVAGQRPVRVCSAPACTNSRRLNRCGGCGAVRYCSEACRDAHWRTHRPECRRMRAEQAAAAAVAGGQEGSGAEAAGAS